MLLLLLALLALAAGEEAGSIADVLKHAGLEKYQATFDERGYDSPSLLRRMSDMDISAIGMDSDESESLKKSIEALVPNKKKKKGPAKKEDPSLIRRRELTFGRLYVDGSPSSFQFKKARFGGELPLKSHEVVFAPNSFGCGPVDEAKGSYLVVSRGECTYLEKAEAAASSGAAGLIVVNTDNGDLFELPAGYDMTPEEVAALPSIPVVLVPLNALDVLMHITKEDPFARAALVPLECNVDGCFPVYKVDLKYLSDYDSSGGRIYVTGADGREVGLDFVTSSFGSVLPLSGEIVPLEGGGGLGCEESAVTNLADLENKIVLVERGGCSFFQKIAMLQKWKARLVVVADDKRGNALKSIGASTEELGQLYLPVIMVTRNSGDKIHDLLRERAEKAESDGDVDMPYATLTRERQVAVLWEEVWNFKMHCCKGEGGREEEEEEKGGGGGERVRAK
ncbi:hypothetical protein TeGR_g6275, partial [Tetraparma gracilis]